MENRLGFERDEAKREAGRSARRLLLVVYVRGKSGRDEWSSEFRICFVAEVKLTGWRFGYRRWGREKEERNHLHLQGSTLCQVHFIISFNIHDSPKVDNSHYSCILQQLSNNHRVPGTLLSAGNRAANITDKVLAHKDQVFFREKTNNLQVNNK